MPSPNPPAQPGRSHVRRHDVAGRDIDEATHFYERVHDAHAVRLTQDEDRPFGYRLRAVGDERLRLRSSALSARRWGRIEPQGRYLVTWAHDGELAIDGGTDTELVVSAGTPPSTRPAAPSPSRPRRASRCTRSTSTARPSKRSTWHGAASTRNRSGSPRRRTPRDSPHCSARSPRRPRSSSTRAPTASPGHAWWTR
ncbi:hypothetical protein [Curtobacterium sp. MCPF17_031]|uniref:hypothetical protein n=1 Tax=Curtobacterium sp. MCPF17_031 TaxID=2175653 RepID=UPI0015E87EAB|nr:hypothetical protein [Curtobacterium sp. MCPF17_031]